MAKRMLNRNEVIQGPAPQCLEVLAKFNSSNSASYFDGYYGSILRPRLSKIFGMLEEQISVGYGIEHFLRAIFDSIKSDDIILINELHYGFYDKYLTSRGVRMEAFNLIQNADRFEFDISDCLQKIKTLKPKVILITSPNNPSGNSIDVKNLEKILEEASKDALVVLDEAYSGFDPAYDEKNFLSLLNQFGNLVILRGFSKFYALAGMRIGFALWGNRAKEMARYQDLYLGGSKILEEVAIAALDSKEYYKNLASEIISDREHFIVEVGKLTSFKVFDSKANFVLVRVSEKVKEKLERLLEKQDTQISKFVSEDLMRVSIGMSENTRIFLKILAEADKE